jgi:hypothetical protein
VRDTLSRLGVGGQNAGSGLLIDIFFGSFGEPAEVKRLRSREADAGRSWFASPEEKWYAR